MGTCCNHRVNFEDIIHQVIDDTEIKKIKFKDLEKELIEVSIDNQISRANFYASITHLIFRKYDNNSNFHERIFENIIFFDGKKDQNIYHVLLVLYIFLSEDNKNDIQDLYRIFVCFYNGSLTLAPDYIIEYDNFKELIYTYIENALFMVTYIIGSVLLEKQNSEKKNIDKNEINYYMNSLYTEQNIEKYIKSILKNIKKTDYFNYKKFENFFSNNCFLFNFKNLRSEYMEFLRKSDESELNKSDISNITN